MRKLSLGLTHPLCQLQEEKESGRTVEQEQSQSSKTSNMGRQGGDSLTKGNKHRSCTKRPYLQVLNQRKREALWIGMNVPALITDCVPGGKQGDSQLNLYKSAPGRWRRGPIQAKLAFHSHLWKTSLLLTPHSNPLLDGWYWRLLNPCS